MNLAPRLINKPPSPRLGLTILLLTLSTLTGAITLSESEQLLLLDDRTTTNTTALNGEHWRLFTDRVMGGVSSGDLTVETIAGRNCLRMRGEVSLENNGGFVQMAIDLGDLQEALGEYSGIELDVYGNHEHYNVHLRTEEMRRPWQSFRATFTAGPEWQTVRLSFAHFEAHRIDATLEPARIRRIGLVAIGREFDANLCLGRLAFYR